MNERKAFHQLGFGAKFDLDRFRNDAEILMLFNKLPSPESKSPLDENKNNSRLEDANGEQENVGDDFDQIVDDVDEEPFRLTKELVHKVATKSKVDEKKKKSRAAVAKQRKQEEVAHFRKRNRIYVWGTDIPDPCPTFEDMINRYKFADGLAATVRGSLASWVPTPVQMQTIPSMLEGREVLASAPTGSGKTLAFVLPVLQHLRQSSRGGFRAIVIEPTRELARQTYKEILKLNDRLGLRVHMITSLDVAQEKFGPQSKRRLDILVSTPNRLVHLLKSDPPCLDLSCVEWLIVDESDKLFESGERGFRDQLAVIYKACSNPRCRRAFFSATFSYDVEQWCKTYLDNVVMVSVGARNTAVKTVQQEIVFVGSEYGKIVELRNLISRGLLPPVLIFVQTKERAQRLLEELVRDKIKVDVIHSQRDRKEREKVVKRFRNGKIWILICTELMGRGIDFKNVSVVINYDFPPSAVSYIHRIGRTGRAGRSGRAVTFFTERDRPLLRSVANVMREAGCPTPDFMLHLKKPSKRTQRKLLRQCVERPEVKILRQREMKGRKRRLDSTAKKGSKRRKSTGGNAIEQNDPIEEVAD